MRVITYGAESVGASGERVSVLECGEAPPLSDGIGYSIPLRFRASNQVDPNCFLSTDGAGSEWDARYQVELGSAPNTRFSGPTARPQTSLVPCIVQSFASFSWVGVRTFGRYRVLGHRPRTYVPKRSRAVGPTQQFGQGFERAYSPKPLWISNLGRCPRLVWGRAFGAEMGVVCGRMHGVTQPVYA